jgi:predicted ArsR family transcriptional regulator
MNTRPETSDDQFLDLMSRRGAMSVVELADASCVTATAVRQRLTRLMSQGLVERDVARQARGRPSHRYRLTDLARRRRGNNFADLATVLWDQLRSIENPEIRRGLLRRLADSMSRMYAGRVIGSNAEEKMKAVCDLFAERGVPIEVQPSPVGPKLTVLDCPYNELAEKDRAICAVEKMLFATLIESPLRLSQCRLDGHTCCQFETSGTFDKDMSLVS